MYFSKETSDMEGKTFNHAPSDVQLIQFPDFVGGQWTTVFHCHFFCGLLRLHLTGCGLSNLRVQRVACCVPNFSGLAGERNDYFLKVDDLCGSTCDKYICASM